MLFLCYLYSFAHCGSGKSHSKSVEIPFGFVNPSGAVKLPFRRMEKSISPLTQIVHPHHLIPPWVNYLDRDALVFPGRERERFGPAELLKPLCVNNAFECLCYFVPRLFVGEKRLGDTEGSSVVVAVKNHAATLSPPAELTVFSTGL